MSRPFHMSDHPDIGPALGIEPDREAAITEFLAPLVERLDSLPACLNAANAGMEFTDQEWCASS